MDKKYFYILIGVFSLLYISTLYYFSRPSPSTPPSVISPPPTAIPTLLPSSIPTVSINPTSTPKPSNITTLKYSLPSGWSEANLVNTTISVGYDPANYSITQNDSNALFIQNNQKSSYADIIISEYKYDNGSRHLFLSKIIGGDLVADRLSGYHEKEYKIGNSTCLFLIGIQPSQSLPTWGICPISTTKAILINLRSLDDAFIEKILKTIKFTGTVAPTLSYQNTPYKFSFQYPSSFSLQDAGGGTVLTSLVNQSGKTIEVLLDQNPLSLNNLKKYAPTGQEDFPPNQSVEFTSPQFYYYGPGGGGVCYPDQFFTGNSNYTLVLRFSGCDNDKTPPQYIKDIERQILKSFRLN